MTCVSETAWQELVGRVARDRDALVADFLAEFAALGGYPSDQVSDADIEGNAFEAIQLFLDHLAEREPSAIGAALPENLGRRRARQGVRLELFLEAVRIDFRVLWRALERASRPDLVETLVRNGERVLNVVERYASEVQRAYLDEEVRMAQLRRTARERAISQLFAQDLSDEGLLAAAETLGLAVAASYEVLVTPEGEAAPERAAGAVAYRDGASTVSFRPRQGPDWPDSDPSLRGGYLAEVAGLRGLRRAAALAGQLAAIPETGGVVRLGDGLTHLAAAALDPAIAGFAGELLGDFLALPDPDRARLEQTLRSFVRTGSIQRTADELFCHRNTIVKRLRAFTASTGLDVTLPRDATVACIALRL